MISIKENHILNKFAQTYEMNIRNTIINLDNINCFKFDELHLPNKLIPIFLKKLTQDETNHLLYSAIVNASNNNDSAFLNDLKTSSNNLVETLPIEILRKIIENAIMLMMNKKIYPQKPTIVKNESECDDILERFNYSKIETLYTKYRYIIYKIIAKINFLNPTPIVEEILKTEKYDNLLIELSNGILNNRDDIKVFKQHLIRIIMFDNYILEIFYMDQKLDELIKSAEKTLQRKIDNIIAPIARHIEECAKNNSYSLPNDDGIIKTMINNFLHFYLVVKDKEEYIKVAEKNNEKTLQLLNPLYKLDDYS